MVLSLYDLPVPILLRSLELLHANLLKAEQHCDTHSLDKHVFLHENPINKDMLPLTRQIQFACDSAKGVLYRVGGQEEVKMEDTEKTFEELRGRVERTMGLLRGVGREGWVDENQEITVKLGPKELKFNSLVYLQNFALPNFFFHRTTAYLIMRAAGVEVGKQDYLGFESLSVSSDVSAAATS